MKKPEYMMFCLKTPEGTLILMTIGHTRGEVWGNSFDFVANSLGAAWRGKYWKRWDSSMRNAARKGYVIVPVEIKECHKK
jgi:hypothetical protein